MGGSERRGAAKPVAYGGGWPSSIGVSVVLESIGPARTVSLDIRYGKPRQTPQDCDTTLRTDCHSSPSPPERTCSLSTGRTFLSAKSCRLRLHSEPRPIFYRPPVFHKDPITTLNTSVLHSLGVVNLSTTFNIVTNCMA